MANRFPLILNTSSNQIQELPSGDSIDLNGSGLLMTGGTNIIAGFVAVGVPIFATAYLIEANALSKPEPAPDVSEPFLET